MAENNYVISCKFVAKYFCIILWLIFVFPVSAAGKDPATAVLLASIFPGAGHFYLGKIPEGLGWCTSEIALALGGWFTADELGNSPPPEYHPLYILAMKEHELSIFAAYREAIQQSQSYKSGEVDDTPLGELISSPFRFENLFSRGVYLFALAGGIIASGEWLYDKYVKEELTGEFADISKVRIGNSRFPRNQGFGLYEGMWLPVSLGAGVGEECCWRGVIQTEFEHAFGKSRGWILASLFFGLGHLYQPGVDNDYYKYYSAICASLGGLYLGWLYQKDGYRLARPIAAHFWFNFISGTVAFLLEPEKNPLQVKIEFGF